MKLRPGVEPELSIGPKQFNEFASNGEYYGLPRDCFRVELGTVVLESQIAEQLDWMIDEKTDTVVNIATVNTSVTVEGETIHLNPGSFCSYIQETDLVSEEDAAD